MARRKDLTETIERIHLYETPFGLSVMATAMGGIMPVKRETARQRQWRERHEFARTFNRRRPPDKPKPKRKSTPPPLSKLLEKLQRSGRERIEKFL